MKAAPNIAAGRDLSRACRAKAARLALWLLPLLPMALPAQAPPSPPDTTTREPMQPLSEQELLERLPPGFMDSTAADTLHPWIGETKSPPGAVLRALALPGWGQFYTEHPVRGSLTAVLETAFFSLAVMKYSDRSDLRDQLARLERQEPGLPENDPRRQELKARIERAGLRAGDYLAYGATTLLLSMLDSYVSAHLYEFDRNFSLSLGERSAGVALKF